MDSIKSKLTFERKEGGIRNQVSGMLGRDKKTEPIYSPRPIAELRDPSLYGAPPKRRVEPPPLLPAGANRTQVENTSPRYGSPTSSSSTRSPPPLPPTSRKGPGAPPALPPRLPPRGNSSPSTVSPTTISPSVGPRPADGLPNQGAVSRLGSAGISVSGFGIGKSSSPSSTQPPPTEGTTWAEKQAALKTANSFHKDPSSVSLNDAKSAASTFNNFRQRHGEQVAAGARTANTMNQKYGIADRVGGLAAGQQMGAGGQHSATEETESTHGSLPTLPLKKKPPPPLPPKRIGGSSSSNLPPVPSSTRPQF